MCIIVRQSVSLNALECHWVPLCVLTSTCGMVPSPVSVRHGTRSVCLCAILNERVSPCATVHHCFLVQVPAQYPPGSSWMVPFDLDVQVLGDVALSIHNWTGQPPASSCLSPSCAFERLPSFSNLPLNPSPPLLSIGTCVAVLVSLRSVHRPERVLSLELSSNRDVLLVSPSLLSIACVYLVPQGTWQGTTRSPSSCSRSTRPSSSWATHASLSTRSGPAHAPLTVPVPVMVTVLGYYHTLCLVRPSLGWAGSPPSSAPASAPVRLGSAGGPLKHFSFGLEIMRLPSFALPLCSLHRWTAHMGALWRYPKDFLPCPLLLVVPSADGLRIWGRGGSTQRLLHGPRDSPCDRRPPRDAPLPRRGLLSPRLFAFSGMRPLRAQPG